VPSIAGNGPHEEMDRRAIACFDRRSTTPAWTRPGLGSVARLLRVGTTTTMSPVPRVCGPGSRGPEHPALVVGCLSTDPGLCCGTGQSFLEKTDKEVGVRIDAQIASATPTAREHPIQPGRRLHRLCPGGSAAAEGSAPAPAP